MAGTADKSWLEGLGGKASAVMADLAAHPFAQIGIIAFCGAWWAIGLPTDILTAGLSILAITLTQMVLNRQADRELDAHRRDLAMHAKIDELLLASKKARNTLVGIEDDLPEEEIVSLKETIKQTVERVAEEAAEEAGGAQLAERTPRAG